MIKMIEWWRKARENSICWKRRDKFAIKFYEATDACKRGKEGIQEREAHIKILIDLLKENINAVCEEGLFSKKECKHFKEWLKKETEEK